MPDARRTDAVLLLVALVWGSSYLSAQTATAVLPVLVVLFARYALSALACLGLVAAGRGSGPWTRDEIRIGLPLGVTQAAVLVVETYGVAHTSAANAGLIISLTIVITPLLDRTGRGGGLPPAFYAAAGVCLLAVGLLMSGDGFHEPRLGDLLMLGAAVIRAGHVALVGRLTAGRAIRPLRLTTVQILVGTALFLVPASGDLSTLVHVGAAGWAQLLYLALFCSVFAFLAQTWAVQRTSASRASLLLGTEPIWAAAVGIALAGDHFTPLTALGAALMVTGTYWGQSTERAHRATKAARSAPSGARGAAPPALTRPQPKTDPQEATACPPPPPTTPTPV
ncbi:drug/metabolite transporter (DMT)-like permease [Streptomyces sp. V3I8]|uniref:DMT family transporter n=1 Tax=Streptomyces sp. V3I8 TaxID=3042279 RepID=UPI00278680A1|nr:DMT family transporter [Streptomyces sp. V3I8]MDQ1035513.1 drug/metabolite transporter (DMT)-like permease [Streptomyces sp. V3I8]